MTPRELMAAFDVVADAPDGIKRLRELVLSLAVRGKLLPSAHAEWLTVSLSTLVEEFQNGTSSRGGEGGPPVVVIRLADIKAGQISADAFRRIDLSPESAQKYELHEGDVLAIRVNGSGDLVGRLVIVEKNAGWCYCDHLIRMRLRSSRVNPRFLQIYASTFEARAHLSSVTVTTAGQKTINQKGLGSLQVPLPPLAEQHRIVARVDELMALLDRLESAHKAREEARRAARDAALAALRDAEDADAVETAWARIAGEMGELFDGPDDIAPLRQSVLRFAVRGRLVPLSTADEPAEQIVRSAMSRRRELSRRWEPLARPTATERVFEAPTNWTWARLDDLCAIASGVTKGRRLEGMRVVTYPYLRVANVQAGHLNLSTMKTIEIPPDELEDYRLLPGDVLLTEGGDWDKLGRSAIWNGEIEDCIHQNHVFRARPLVEGVTSRWLSLYTNSGDGRDYFQSCAKQTTNLASINMTQLKNCPIPLPPLAEQHRIVAKVDAILALCDTLEDRLRAARELHAQLAAAAVHHLDV